MTTRRPLVVPASGLPAQMPAGDTVPVDALGTGAPSSANFLRGDGTWAAPSSGSSVPLVVASGSTYSVPTNTQAVFSGLLELDGAAVVDGRLAGV